MFSPISQSGSAEHTSLLLGTSFSHAHIKAASKACKLCKIYANSNWLTPLLLPPCTWPPSFVVSPTAPSPHWPTYSALSWPCVLPTSLISAPFTLNSFSFSTHNERCWPLSFLRISSPQGLCTCCSHLPEQSSPRYPHDSTPQFFSAQMSKPLWRRLLQLSHVNSTPVTL